MDRWSKRYYQLLIAGLCGFILMLIAIGLNGASSPVLFLAFFLFYLAYKNGLQAWIKNQIAKDDPEFQERYKAERQQKKEMWKVYLLPRSPWYRNESIAVVLLLMLAIYLGLR